MVADSEVKDVKRKSRNLLSNAVVEKREVYERNRDKMQEATGQCELPDRSEVSAAIERVIAVALTIVAMLGNTLIIAAFGKKKALRTIPNRFVFNLSIVDILAVFTIHPLLVAVLISGRWFLGPEACKYQAILKSFLFINSHLSITLISLNRYFIIVRYKKHSAIFTKHSTHLFLVAIWIVSLFLSLSPLMANERIEFQAKEAVCDIIVQNSSTCILTTVVGNTGFITTVCLNFAIFRSVRSHRRQVSFTLNQNSIPLQSRTGRGEACRSDFNRRRSVISIQKEQLYIARKVIIVISLYTLCWLPQGILKNAKLAYAQLPREIWMTSTFSMQLNSLLNPILYGMLNRKFRKVIFEMLGIQKRNFIQSTVIATNFHTTGFVHVRVKQPFTVEGCLVENTTL